MAARGPVHIASEAARRAQSRTGASTRCGAPLAGVASVAFYWDIPVHEDLLADTCNECITTYQNERRTDGKQKVGRRNGAHFGH